METVACTPVSSVPHPPWRDSKLTPDIRLRSTHPLVSAHGSVPQPAAYPILSYLRKQCLALSKNSKAHADSLLEQQQVFEEALARNDATHEARLRRLKLEMEERNARQAETATVAAAVDAAAAIGAHGRQAGAAVAAMAAAGVTAQTQQASAMAAQAAMFLEFQVCGVWVF